MVSKEVRRVVNFASRGSSSAGIYLSNLYHLYTNSPRKQTVPEIPAKVRILITPRKLVTQRHSHLAVSHNHGHESPNASPTPLVRSHHRVLPPPKTLHLPRSRRHGSRQVRVPHQRHSTGPESPIRVSPDTVTTLLRQMGIPGRIAGEDGTA